MAVCRGPLRAPVAPMSASTAASARVRIEPSIDASAQSAPQQRESEFPSHLLRVGELDPHHGHRLEMSAHSKRTGIDRLESEILGKRRASPQLSCRSVQGARKSLPRQVDSGVTGAGMERTCLIFTTDWSRYAA